MSKERQADRLSRMESLSFLAPADDVRGSPHIQIIPLEIKMNLSEASKLLCGSKDRS